MSEEEEINCVDSIDEGNNPGIYLPPEIVEKILSYVDGKTLAASRLVSKCWKALADRRIRFESHIWIKFCVSEIPMEQIHDFLSHHDPQYFLKPNPTPGLSKIYKRWNLWQSALSLNKTVSHIIESKNALISELKCSGDYIFIAAHNALYCYNYKLCEIKQMLYLDIHCHELIKWLHLRSKVFPQVARDGAFHDLAHDVVVFEMTSDVYEYDFRPRFPLKKLYEKRKSSFTRQFMAQDDVQVFLDATQHSCTLHVELNSGEKTSKFLDGQHKLLTLYHSCVMLLDCRGNKVRIFDLDLNEIISHPLHHVVLKERWNLSHYVIGLDAILTYSIGGGEPLRINHEGSSTIMTMLSSVSALLFYGNHLFLGTKYGQLIIFYIKSLEELFLLEEDIMQDPERKDVLKICDKTIISIDVSEDSPYTTVFVASSSDIYKISFSLYQNLSKTCIEHL